MRKQFVETVNRLLDENDGLVLLLGDIGVHGFRDAFKKHPDRVFNIGILEQATVSVAAGWALRGYVPIVHTIAPFIVERAFEQLKLDFGYQRLPGLFVGVGGSYDYAGLGCTHHCPADVSLIENIPGFITYVPGSTHELNEALEVAIYDKRPSYTRMSEQKNSTTYPLGASIVQHGTNVCIIAVGPCLDMVMEAAKGLDVEVCYTNIPRFRELSDSYHMNQFSHFIVVEPYYSSLMCEQISEYFWPRAVSVNSFSVERMFVEHYGKKAEVDTKINFTPSLLREAIKVCLDNLH